MSAARRRQARPAASVLIPTLNEAEALPALLGDLAAQHGLRFEVIVADGGSSDATVAIAQQHGATVVAAPRGRAAQFNAAVAAARAPWLICLHADSRLTAPDQLARGLALLHGEPGVVAGHWALRFVRTQPGHDLLFRQLQAKSASNRPGTVNGDQGLVIHRDTLAVLGGFDASLPFFEDQRLAARVFAQGRFMLLPGVIETAARRFEVEGHRTRLLLMALIVGAEAAGLEDWLASLPALYRAQNQATALLITPFLQALSAHLRELPSARQRQVQCAVGALLTANAWQLALLMDTRSQRERPHWLRGFDRLLARPATRAPWPMLAGSLMLAGIHTAARLSKRT